MQSSPKLCPACGRAIHSGARFCGECGSALPAPRFGAADSAKNLDRLESLQPPQPVSPPHVAGFVGRTAELAYFKAKLMTEHLVVITGLSGMGKTALAATLARQVADTHSIFWHAFRKDEGIDVIIWELAAFLAWHGHNDFWVMLQGARQSGGQPLPPALLFDYFVQAIRGQSYLLCFDDLQFVSDDPLLDQLVSRLRAVVLTGDIKLLLTSRYVPAFAQTLDFEPLDGLSTEDARNLLAARELVLPDGLAGSLIELTGGNAQLLLLAIDALGRAREPARLIERLVETENIERYLLLEVDAGLTDEQRAVISAIAVLLGYPASRAAIAAVLSADDGGHLLRADAYSTYDFGLEQLLSMITPSYESYTDALVYQQRLVENITLARRYGDTDNRKAERAELVDRLNGLALKALGQSFTELSGEIAPTLQFEPAERVRDLRRTLSDLVSRNLLIVSEDDLGRHYYEHAMVQSFYYSLLGRRERKALHLRAGTYYETEERDALRGARHFEQIGEYGHAARLVIGDIETIINQGQARALGRLLAELPIQQLESAMQCAMSEAYGDVQYLLGELDQAIHDYRAAVVTVDQSDELAQIRLYRKLGTVLARRSENEAALECLARAQALLAEAADAKVESAWIAAVHGTVLLALGRYDEAAADAQAALDQLREPAANLRIAADLHDLIGKVYFFKGHFAGSLERFQSALELRKAGLDQQGMIKSYSNLAVIYGQQNRYAEALLSNETALEVAERIGDTVALAMLYTNMAADYVDQGIYDRALDLHNRSLALCTNMGNITGLALAHRNLGDVYRRMERYDLAAENLAVAIKLAEQVGQKHEVIGGVQALAEVYLAQGHFSEAIEKCRESLHLSEDIDNQFHRPVSLDMLGRIYHATGQWEQARRSFGDACQMWRAREAWLDLANTLLSQTRLERDAGQVSRASELCAEALILAHTYGGDDLSRQASALLPELK